MSEYVIGIFAICLAGGLSLSLAYGLGRAEGIAVGIITLWVILSPLSGQVGSLDINELIGSSEIEQLDPPQIDPAIESALAEGIKAALSEEFSIDREDIRVRLYDFDAGSLSCSRIRITLSGRAILADYKAVESYINKMNIGECDVEIEIG